MGDADFGSIVLTHDEKKCKKCMVPIFLSTEICVSIACESKNKRNILRRIARSKREDVVCTEVTVAPWGILESVKEAGRGFGPQLTMEMLMVEQESQVEAA